jgi:hypothetical protein
MWLKFECAYISIYQTCTCCKQQKIKSYAENIGGKNVFTYVKLVF